MAANAKAVVANVPSLVESLSGSVKKVVDAVKAGNCNEGMVAGMEHDMEQLFEVANIKVLALPGITDGSDVMVLAENVASKTRTLVRLNLKALAKHANAGNTDKVRSLNEKAVELMQEINNLVDDINEK